MRIEIQPLQCVSLNTGTKWWCLRFWVPTAPRPPNGHGDHQWSRLVWESAQTQHSPKRKRCALHLLCTRHQNARNGNVRYVCLGFCGGQLATIVGLFWPISSSAKPTTAPINGTMNGRKQNRKMVPLCFVPSTVQNKAILLS